MKVVFLLAIALLLLPFASACVVPKENMEIRRSVELCGDVYSLNQPLRIVANNVALTCQASVLKTWRGGTGIIIEGVNNVTISGCRLNGHDVGFLVKNSSQVFLRDNHLINTKVGARFFNVSKSATLNHDVSLQTAFDVRDSVDNSLSLKNKKVVGLFCEKNFCNVKESATQTFMAPKLSLPKLVSWVKSKITGKSEESLRAHLLSGLV